MEDSKMNNSVGLSEQVIDFLEEHKGEVFSAEELREHFDVVWRVLTKKLSNLLKHNEIGFERISFRVARKIYKNPNIKRGLNVYFLE